MTRKPIWEIARTAKPENIPEAIKAMSREELELALVDLIYKVRKQYRLIDSQSDEIIRYYKGFNKAVDILHHMYRVEVCGVISDRGECESCPYRIEHEDSTYECEHSFQHDKSRWKEYLFEEAMSDD